MRSVFSATRRRGGTCDTFSDAYFLALRGRYPQTEILKEVYRLFWQKPYFKTFRRLASLIKPGSSRLVFRTIGCNVQRTFFENSLDPCHTTPERPRRNCEKVPFFAAHSLKPAREGFAAFARPHSSWHRGRDAWSTVVVVCLCHTRCAESGLECCSEIGRAHV